MFKKLSTLVLIVFFALNINAKQASVKNTAVYTILKLTDEKLREQKLIRFIKDYFGYFPVKVLDTSKVQLNQLLQQYNIENRLAYQWYIESICQQRLSHTTEAIIALNKAIEFAGYTSDHYLLYSFFSNLAFYQTTVGNTIDAVSSYRAAKKEAILMNDYYSEVIVDINISDIYYKNNFYGQSVSYLDQAENIYKAHHVTETKPRILNIIIYNKAENYFRLDSLDSLKKYNLLLNKSPRPYKLYIFKNRTNYYIQLLNHNYKLAINHIKALRTDTAYKFDETDEQNLADAYYHAGMPDSAKYIINALLNKQTQSNHPEIEFHLYEVLAGIAELEHNDKQAAYNFKMALQESKDHINRLTQVGVISSKMNVDEMQRSYIQREETYRRERLLLIFVVIVAVLTIIIGTMLYRSAKQKRYYEKLLFNAKKEELAFINSHEVRRHLSNILGLIAVIKSSKNKSQEYIEAEEHLLHAAESLDEAIRNISEKLDD